MLPPPPPPPTDGSDPYVKIERRGDRFRVELIHGMRDWEPRPIWYRRSLKRARKKADRVLARYVRGVRDEVATYSETRSVPPKPAIRPVPPPPLPR